MNRFFFALLALVSLLFLPSCAPPADPPFTGTSYCAARAERPCEREERECRLEREWSESDCWTACLSLGDCSACARLASEPSWCNQCRYDRSPPALQPCVDLGFSFHRAAVEDASVREACRRSLATATACGVTIVGDPCPDRARVQRTEMSAVYDCRSAAGCDAEAYVACEAPPAVHGLEPTVCGLLSARCGTTCSDELAWWLERYDGWLRYDVVAALQICLDTPACGDYVECVNAWSAAVRGD